VFTIPTLFALSLIIYYTTTFFSPIQRVALFMPTSPYRHPGHDIYSVTDKLIEKYRLNDPFYVHYSVWIGGVLKGNLGYSYSNHKPVIDAILQNLPATLELVMYAAPITFLGGYRLGVFSAKRAHKKAPKDDITDSAIRTVSIFGYSIPQFCIGLLLLVIFYMCLGWFKPGRLASDCEAFLRSSDWTHYTGLYTIDALLNGEPWILWDALKHLVLPVITLSTGMLPIVIRVTRSAMLGELTMPYVTTAKAKGLDEKAVSRHAERNSLSSVLTVSGILLASMLTGVVVTEHVFLIRGLGFMTVNAAQEFDYPLLIGLAITFCLIFVLINLLVEIAYARINPRVTL
jgi:ABC-type dipeptide/oligopeptide/nickel transport system permease component